MKADIGIDENGVMYLRVTSELCSEDTMLKFAAPALGMEVSGYSNEDYYLRAKGYTIKLVPKETP